MAFMASFDCLPWRRSVSIAFAASYQLLMAVRLGAAVFIEEFRGWHVSKSRSSLGKRINSSYEISTLYFPSGRRMLGARSSLPFPPLYSCVSRHPPSILASGILNVRESITF